MSVWDLIVKYAVEFRTFHITLLSETITMNSRNDFMDYSFPNYSLKKKNNMYKYEGPLQAWIFTNENGKTELEKTDPYGILEFLQTYVFTCLLL